MKNSVRIDIDAIASYLFQQYYYLSRQNSYNVEMCLLIQESKTFASSFGVNLSNNWAGKYLENQLL